MLGCIQPMSSPMMKRMLGFAPCEVWACGWGCATAGRLIAIPSATPVSQADHLPRFILTAVSFYCRSCNWRVQLATAVDALSRNAGLLYWTVGQHGRPRRRTAPDSGLPLPGRIQAYPYSWPPRRGVRSRPTYKADDRL